MKELRVVFDGPPSHATGGYTYIAESGRFIEVEDETGKSIGVGSWHERPDGYWGLRLSRHDFSSAASDVTPEPPAQGGE